MLEPVHDLERQLRRPVRIAADRRARARRIDHVRVELRDHVEVDVDPSRAPSLRPRPCCSAEHVAAAGAARPELPAALHFRRAGAEPVAGPISPSDSALNSPIRMAASRMRALRGRYTAIRTSLSRPSAAAEKPWPRISTTAFAAEHARHVAALRHVDHQQIGLVAEFFGDIPHRHVRAHVARHVRDAAHRRLGDAERQDVLGVRMHHGVDVRPRLVDRAVDEALEIGRARVAHRRAVEPELDDVGAGDEFRAERARQQIVVGLLRVADADVAVGVDHVLLRQDPIGDHQIADRALQLVHASVLPGPMRFGTPQARRCGRR